MYLKLFFILVGSLLAVLFILEQIFICRIKDNMKKSSFVSFLAGVLVLYVMASLALTAVLPHIYDKVLLFLFALSPFVIGRLVKYDKVTIFSIIQILCIIISVGYVILI